MLLFHFLWCNVFPLSGQALEEISDAGKSAETGLELMYDAANGAIHNI